LQVLLAEKAGFCTGVKRAFKIAEEASCEDGSWCTLGPLVHNDGVTSYFESKGMAVNRITIESKGEKEPADNNNTETRCAKNRRTVKTKKKKKQEHINNYFWRKKGGNKHRNTHLISCCRYYCEW